MGKNHSQEIEELKVLLRCLGHENVWRPVVSPDNASLADGIGDENDGIVRYLHLIDFVNKTVIDLGCNLGYFSFIAKKAGATQVLGIDNDASIIRGCNIIKKLHQAEDIDFQVANILTLTGEYSFDIGMMIDFIGKKSIISGLFPKFLEVLELVSRKQMILSIRPVYRVAKHLGNDSQGLLQKYPGKYVRDGCFYALEYSLDRFRENWCIDTIGATYEKEEVTKEIVVLLRKT
jgi:SAM-dependent methyltransferase